MVNLILFSAPIGLMGIATVNLNSVLVSTADIAFLEAPWKAWLISALAPMASISLKCLPMAFEYPSTKRLYKKGLYSLTAIAILVWIYLVADTFQGMGGGFDVDTLLEASAQGSMTYVLVQLLTEVLMAATLFSAWQSQLDSYHPKPVDEQVRALNKALAVNAPLVKTAQDAVYEATDTLNALKTQRAVFINQQIEALTLQKAKHHFLNNHFGDQ